MCVAPFSTRKNGANTQSFLCPLIQFAGVASCINEDYQIFFVMSSVCLGY